MRNASYQMKSAVPSNIRWETIEWKEITRYVVKLQQRIYRAEVQGNNRRVRDLQRLALHSRAVLLLSIKRVTQTNKGKKTPGIDGETALTGKERIELYQEMSRKDIQYHKAKPSYRTYKKRRMESCGRYQYQR